MNAIHAAQAAFLESEAREVRQRAVRAKTGTTSLVYELEDIVYFNRENSNLWKGPVTVIGWENKQILVKYAGMYLRLHACQLQHVKKVKTSTECDIEDEKDQTNITTAEIPYPRMKHSKFRIKAVKYHYLWQNCQISDNTSQNNPNVVSSDNTEDNISGSAYPIKTYIVYIVYINPE